MVTQQSTVLVVDDEPLIRLAMAAAAEDAGYHVIEAGSVLDAVALLSRNPIDALITDVDMPGGLSGLDLADLVSAVSNASIVIVSGRSLPPSYQMPRGASFFPKPYNCDQILFALSHAGAQLRAAGPDEAQETSPGSAIGARLCG